MTFPPGRHDGPTTGRPPGAVVVVTGANGFVGSHVCRALSERGVTVRAVVRRGGTAPRLPPVEEHVGDFHDQDVATAVVAGASAVVTTVHPMQDDRDTQRRVAIDGTLALARSARDAGVARLVHLSTAGVYDRSPGVGDVGESAPLVGDTAHDYLVSKRDADRALADPGLDGLTRILVRPPAILGSGATSVWNSVVPAEIRDHEAERHAVPEQTFAWVHVTDLVTFVGDLAVGGPTADDPEHGPVAGLCTPVNVAAAPATRRDYLTTVAEALGVEPVWEDGAAWTGRVRADRARSWGWSPTVGLSEALAELAGDVRALG